MIACTDTDESLELVTLVPGSGVEWTSSFAQLADGALDLDSAHGSIATPSTATIVAAPGANARRQLKYLSARNIDSGYPQTVVVQKRVGGSVYRVSPHVNLMPGEVLTYQDGKAWRSYTDRGRLKRSGKIVPQLPALASPHGFYAGNQGGSEGLSPNGAIDYMLCCMGRASRRITSVELRWELVIAPGTITWAEAFVGRGEVALSRTPGVLQSLIMFEPRGAVDISASLGATGRKTSTIPVQFPIEPGDNLWVGIGGLFGVTAPTFRSSNAQTEVMQLALYFSSGSGGGFERPSLTLGGQYAVLGASGDAFPWIGIRTT